MYVDVFCDIFFGNDTATTEIYTYLHTLSLHVARPIYGCAGRCRRSRRDGRCRQGCGRHGRGRGQRRRQRRRRHGERRRRRSEEHTSELQSLMRISYAVFCLKNKIKLKTDMTNNTKIYMLTMMQLHNSRNNELNV